MWSRRLALTRSSRLFTWIQNMTQRFASYPTSPTYMCDTHKTTTLRDQHYNTYPRYDSFYFPDESWTIEAFLFIAARQCQQDMVIKSDEVGTFHDTCVMTSQTRKTNFAQRIARIHDLDMKHQSNIHQIDIVNKDEEARRLKLRVLSLRDDNTLLQDKIIQKDAQITTLRRDSQDVVSELAETKQKSKQQDVQLQKQTKELAALKVMAIIRDESSTC